MGLWTTCRSRYAGAETGIDMAIDPASDVEAPATGQLIASEDVRAAARALDVRHRAAVRAVTEDLLRLADAGPNGDPQRPGDVAAAWLMEFTRPNTRQAYAADLAAFFVWCARRPVDVWAVRRYHLADYLSQHKPDATAYAPKTLERRLAAISGFYLYATLASSSVTHAGTASR